MPEQTIVCEKAAIDMIQRTLNQQNENLAYLTAQAKIQQQARVRSLVCKSLLVGVAIGAGIAIYFYLSSKKKNSAPVNDEYMAEELD